MSELIKSVRIRPIEGSTDDLKIGRLDTKVSLFRDNRRTRNCIGYSISSTGDELGVNWSSIEYQGRRYNDLSDDDIIKDYIRTNTLKERPREGEFVNLEGNQVPFYKIVQDPFEKTPPSVRIYGSDPYYLNNGCQVFIRWYTSEKKTISWSYNNVSTPDQVTNGIVSIQITTNEPNRPPITFTYDSTNNPLQTGTTPSYIDIEIYWDYQSGQLFSLTSNELVYQPPGKTFIDDSKLVSSGGEKYGSKSNESYAIDGFIDDARDSITQSISIKPEGLVKTVEVIPPGEDEVWVISSKTDDRISNFFPVYKKDLNESMEIKYFLDNSYSGDFSRGQDWMILSSLLNAWNKNIPNYNVQLCQPSFIENVEIEYKDPLKPVDDLVTEPEPETVDNSKKKIKILFSDNFQVKVREDSPEFTITIGELSINTEDGFVFSDDQDDLLDDEFRESAFVGEEESPSNQQEVNESSSRKDEFSSEDVFITPTFSPGKVIKLPETYSHTKKQGFNILDSQWIGNLVTSAKSHLKHPTYDIDGTEKGNLGCASAVSMIFYRAFGVHMKTGKEVKSKPESIGSFGSKGTAELGNWFESSPNLYKKIPWESAQPGDIMNTSRNFSTNQAGHIGIVIDVKDNDGSWAIVSNSSKGFEGGGGGAIKQNYSVKKWKSVYNRNPSKTFAYRYIGPSLVNNVS